VKILKEKIVHLVLNDFVNDSRIIKECEVAVALGFEVHVFAIKTDTTLSNEILNGVNIHRINLRTKKLSKKRIIQLIKYLEFYWKIKREVSKLSDLKIIHVNDLGPLPIAKAIKRNNNNIKILYDAHEHETEANGVSGFRKKITKFMEARYIKHADQVITVSNSIAEDYKKLYSIEKPKVILNAPKYREDTSVKPNLLRRKFNLNSNDFIYIYQGALTSGRGIDMILKAFQNIDNNSHVIFMGNGTKSKDIIKYSKNYPNIHYLEAVPQKELLNYTMSADIGLCIIEPICKSYEMCLPNKFFEYNMANIPVIINKLIEIEPIIEKYNSGYIINSTNELQELICTLDKNEYLQKKINTKLVSETYNWEKQAKQLSSIYTALSTS